MIYREKVQNCSNDEETFTVKAESRLILKAFAFFLDCNRGDQISMANQNAGVVIAIGCKRK